MRFHKFQYASTIKIEGKNGGIKEVYVCTACTYEESHTKKGAVKTFSNSFTFKQHYKVQSEQRFSLMEYFVKERFDQTEATLGR